MTYLLNNLDTAWALTVIHLRLSLIPVVLGLLIAVPLGALVQRTTALRRLTTVTASIVFTIPSLAAKNPMTWLMKWRSSSVSFSQWATSEPRSTSSAVQKEASAFLYISQIWLYLIGNRTNLSLFSSNSGSGARLLLLLSAAGGGGDGWRRVRVSARGSRREGGCIRISGKQSLGDSGRPEKHHGGAR